MWQAYADGDAGEHGALSTKKLWDAAKDDAATARILFFYQWFLRLVLVRPEFGLGGPAAPRGLLVYHPMGMGKTRLAVAVALALGGARGTFAPLLVAKRSLHRNFSDTVAQVVRLLGGDDAAVTAAQARFSYVTADAHNMADQIARVTQGLPARKGKERGRGDVHGASLNRRLVIVDEAHNLFRAIINAGEEGSNARRFYAMAMEARDVRFLFLTGTPASKDPFELVPCFNMLAGRDILPTDYETFNRLYVGEKGVRNENLLANRILGYVSHVDHTLPMTVSDSATGTAGGAATGAATGTTGATGATTSVASAASATGATGATNISTSPIGSAAAKKEMPVDVGTTVVGIEMTPPQYHQYLSVRGQEEAGSGPSSRKQYGGPAPATPALSLPGRGAMGSYYMKSRAVQNVYGEAFGEWARGDRKGGPPLSASPKIAAILARLKAAKGPVAIYSQFAGVAGGEAVAAYLEAAGYPRWVPGKDAGKPTYAMFTGDVPTDERQALVHAWNREDNLRGEKIRAIVISGAGAEGLDLWYVREVHILEPYWDRSRELQVKHRGIRTGSHAALPPEDRTVATYIYVARANAAVEKALPPGAKIEDVTVDERFLKRGVRKHRLNDSFRALLRSVSLECLAFGYGGCRSCQQTSGEMPLYLNALRPERHPDAEADLTRPDPCKAPVAKTTQVEALPVEIEGDPGVYAYTPRVDAGTPLRLYRLDPDLEGYVELHPRDPEYERVRDAATGSTGSAAETTGSAAEATGSAAATPSGAKTE